MKKINVITLCSGYDSQCLALKRVGIDFDLIAWAEFDPESTKPLEEQPAVIAHNILFPQFKDRNVGDMTKADWNKFKNEKIDLLCYSTPCQSVSCAGKQEGIAKGSDTTSSILWDTEQAIDILRPKYLLQENVKNLVGTRFKPFFEEWCRTVEKYDYTNYYAVLNASDYGVPQNRERVFMVSVRNDLNKKFEFPKPFKLTTKLEDILEDEETIDEKYFITQDRVKRYIDNIKVMQAEKEAELSMETQELSLFDE